MRRSARGVVLVLLALLALVSVIDLGVGSTSLFAGLADLGGFLARCWPLDFPPPDEILRQAGRTLAVVLLATLLSVLLGGILAIVATTGRAQLVARAALTAARALPDIVLAVVFVRFFGLGPVPAILAMGLHSTGMVGRLGADAIIAAPGQAAQALRTAGASRLQAFCGGVLPEVAPAFVAIGLHRFDLNLRVSAVLGFVGVTGIGTELARSFGRLDHPRAMAWAVVLIALCAVAEVLSALLRRAILGPPRPSFLDRRLTAGSTVSPPWTGRRLARTAYVLLTAAVLGWAVTTGGVLDIRFPGGWAGAADTLARFWPPDPAGAGDLLLPAMVTTVEIALAATLLGAALAVPLGSLAARNVAPHRFARIAVRGLILGVRGLPEPVLAIVFVIIAGPGPVAATLALTLGAAGLLGRLVADTVEQVPPGPAEALRAVGASRVQVYAGAILPQSWPAVLGQILYQLDANVRAATLLGLVGGGGIGLYLLQAARVREYGLVTLILLLVFGVVLALEGLARWLTRDLPLRELKER